MSMWVEVNLWGHFVEGTDLSGQVIGILSMKPHCAKVNDFSPHLVHQHVLGLHISLDNIFQVEVAQPTQQNEWQLITFEDQ